MAKHLICNQAFSVRVGVGAPFTEMSWVGSALGLGPRVRGFDSRISEFRGLNGFDGTKTRRRSCTPGGVKSKTKVNGNDYAMAA